MDRHDGWFSPEDVEEQIEWHLHSREQASANTRMLQELQHIAKDDVRLLADIRARLVENKDGTAKREPVPLQGYQHTSRQLPRRQELSSAKKSWQFPVKLVSGLVATLLIGSMLLVFRNFGAHLEQGKLGQQTPIVTSGAYDVHAISAFLMDATSGKVLVDVNSHVRRPIASMATIMTAVVAIENADPNQYVTVEQTTLSAVSKGKGTAGLQAGDQISLHDLLYGLLLPSGDDAALVIAQAVGSNAQKFVGMMNDEAHQLQLNDTHFADPYSSSSPENYSSAADLVKLATYATQMSTFAQIVATHTYTLAATSQHHSYQWRTTNILLTAYPGVNSIQVAYDERSGACVVFSAQKNDQFLIGAELNAPSEKVLGSDVTRLLERGAGR